MSQTTEHHPILESLFYAGRRVVGAGNAVFDAVNSSYTRSIVRATVTPSFYLSEQLRDQAPDKFWEDPLSYIPAILPVARGALMMFGSAFVYGTFFKGNEAVLRTISELDLIYLTECAVDLAISSVYSIGYLGLREKQKTVSK